MALKNILSLLTVFLTVSSAVALPNAKNLEISKMFSDNMVLQRGIKVPVWGWATPGGTVEIKFNGQTVEAVVDDNGKWMVKLESMKAGGPFEMIISGEKHVKFKNVMVGDVWLCGGQSNMAWPLRFSKNSKQELADANYSQIRLFSCPICTDQTPQEHLPSYTGKWKECSPKTAAGFSGVGYFFGRDLFKELNVPIGLISSNLGGTAIELWISKKDLQNEPGSKKVIEKFEKQCADPKLQEKLNVFYEAKNKVSRYIKEIQSYSPESWTKPDFDSKTWKTFDTSKPEAKKGRIYAQMNLRKTIEIPQNWKGKDLTVYIYYPMIYGHSKLFYNGQEVKRESKWLGHHLKSYPVKGEFVKPGKTVIAEHLFSYQYGKRFQEGRGRSYITARGTDKKIELSGIWDIKILDKFKPQREPMHVKNRKALNGLYNAMINPIIPFAIKGVIWYQGERNVSKAYHYRKLLPLMINSWRNKWKQGDFPFLIVQLANYGKPVNEPGISSWAELREAQAMTAENVSNCGIATAIDVGEAGNIHPTNKQDVGARLALVARKVVYGQNIVYSGPIYQSMEKKGNKIILKFKHTGSGLIAKGGKLKHFSIAGKDRKFLWANAVIDGDTVVVSSEKITDPVAVRYAWAQNPEGCNLYNKEGLPGIPFRTDDWKCSR